MKIQLRMLCPKETVEALRRDAQIAGVVDLDAVTFALNTDDPVFDRFLERTAVGSGCWMNPVMLFSEVEMSEARLFQLECRKLLRETPADYDANITRLGERPFVEISGFRTKTLDRVALHHPSLRPNQVGCAGDWTAEFVVSRGVAHVFEANGLTGFSLRPVYSARTGVTAEDVGMLYTEHRLPPAELDGTTPAMPDEEGGHRQLACLTYDLSGMELEADFYRTAENWSSNYMPVWVVSGRVRDVFIHNKLRGWAFRPVLEKGMTLHEGYVSQWRELLDRIAAANPRHHF